MNKNLINLNQIYLHISNHLNKNQYQATALFNIVSFFKIQMSLEDFQILDSEPFDDSIIKRDCLKIYHQQGASLNDSNQNVLFIFVENNIYHQLANGYLEFDIIVQDTAGIFTNASVIRLTSNAFAHCFKDAVLSTTGGSDLEHIKVVGPVSAIMRLLTSKDSDLFSCFDENY